MELVEQYISNCLNREKEAISIRFIKSVKIFDTVLRRSSEQTRFYISTNHSVCAEFKVCFNPSSGLYHLIFSDLEFNSKMVSELYTYIKDKHLLEALDGLLTTCVQEHNGYSYIIYYDDLTEEVVDKVLFLLSDYLVTCNGKIPIKEYMNNHNKSQIK